MTSPIQKKILYLITKSNWGGAQRYVFDLATHLDAKDFDVVVALGGTGKLYDELKAQNIRTISLESLQRNISIIEEFRALKELWHHIRNEKPDILHINSSKAGGLGACIGRLAGVPKIIFTAHGWAFNEERPVWQRAFIKVLHWITVLLAHTTITVSDTARMQMNLPFTKARMVTIHNGRAPSHLFAREVAREFFMHTLPALIPYMHDFWSVTIAELHPIKQHKVIIHALHEVVKTSPNVRHIIIGAGELRGELQALVHSLHLDEHVFFAGHIHEASQYLSAFDAFVLASKSEGLAYVVIEACVAGLPIIASDVGGIPEIITHEVSGLLVPSGDVATLSTAMHQVARDEALRRRLGENAALRSKDFTFDNMLRETLTVYK